jgi:hypothetical protein
VPSARRAAKQVGAGGGKCDKKVSGNRLLTNCASATLSMTKAVQTDAQSPCRVIAELELSVEGQEAVGAAIEAEVCLAGGAAVEQEVCEGGGAVVGLEVCGEVEVVVGPEGSVAGKAVVELEVCGKGEVVVGLEVCVSWGAVVELQVCGGGGAIVVRLALQEHILDSQPICSTQCYCLVVQL